MAGDEPVGTERRQYQRPYLDANVWIDYFAGPESPSSTQDRAELAKEIFDRALDGHMNIVASTAIAVEVLKDPETDEPELGEVPRFFRRSCFLWVQLDLPVAEHARLLARKYSTKPMDAIHLASALRGEADVLFTHDGEHLPPGDYEGLRVCEPYYPFARKLPDVH